MRYRLQCEARAVLRLPLHARREYLERLPDARRAGLENEIRQQWDEARNPRAP